MVFVIQYYEILQVVYYYEFIVPNGTCSIEVPQLQSQDVFA